MKFVSSEFKENLKTIIVNRLGGLRAPWPSLSLSHTFSLQFLLFFLREALRWTLFTMQATGHVLLGTSCYMQQLLDAPEEQKEEILPSLSRPSIALPSSLTRRMLQWIWGAHVRGRKTFSAPLLLRTPRPGSVDILQVRHPPRSWRKGRALLCTCWSGKAQPTSKHFDSVSRF